MPVEWDGDRQKVRARARRRMGLWAIVSMCMVCLFLYLKVITHRQALESAPADCPKRWHGGSKSHAGSCWCGWDGYCMCTPSLAIDTVVEVSDHVTGEVGSVLVVRRRDNGKLACIGGFVEVGETLEEATRREVREETGLEVTSLEMLPRVYDDPGRDARRHTVSVAYVARTKGVPRPGSDAAAVVSIPLAALRGKLGDFAFDHGQILSDYLARAEAATVVKTGPPLPQRYGGGSIGGVGGSGSAGGGGGVDVFGGGGGSSSGGSGGGNSDGSGSGRGGAESGGSVLGAGRKQQPVITGATQLRAPPAR